MTDDLLAYSVAKMKEYGIVDSGDALTLGIGAMTDARMKDFLRQDGARRRRQAGSRLPQVLHAAIRRQEGRARSAAEVIACFIPRRGRMISSHWTRADSRTFLNPALAGDEMCRTKRLHRVPRPSSRCAASARHFPTARARSQGSISKFAPGEFLSLLGPSGCGKSTALAHHRRTERADRGRGRMAGGGARPAGNGSRIGFVFQEPTLMPWATVFNNVLLPLNLHNAPAATGGRARRGGARPRRAAAVRPRLSARIVRRHAHARLDRARPCHRAGSSS